MNERQRNIVKIAALADIVIAIGLAFGILVGGLTTPIIIPLLLALCGIGLFIGVSAVK